MCAREEGAEGMEVRAREGAEGMEVYSRQKNQRGGGKFRNFGSIMEE